MTCGQHKPLKHALLPNAIKSLTGNVAFIRILNRFGHGMSYSHLEENDTGLCRQKSATGLSQRVVLPLSITPHVPTNLAWNNIDRIEETLSGNGYITSAQWHNSSGQGHFGPHPPRPERPPIQKLKQRSVNVEHKAA